MPVVFKTKTGEAYVMKILAELLSQNLKDGCFEVEDSGISLRQMDNNRRTLVDLDLLAENFNIYKFKEAEKFSMGLNSSQLHRLLKTVKKKDSIELKIDSESPTDLTIITIPKETLRRTTSYIRIQNKQSIELDLPTGYDKPVIVNSSEFQKTCKDLLNIGRTIIVESQGPFGITFYSDADQILKRKVEFGEVEDSDNEESEDENPSHHYRQTFFTDQLSRIAKIAGLSTQMQIYCAKDLPLLFRSNVGSLGRISIYIKSKETIEKEEEERLRE